MISIEVINSVEKFNVNNIFCVGKNYADHIIEMQDNKSVPDIPKEPVIFLKPNTSVISDGGKVTIPVFNGKAISNSLQNEVELVIAIGIDGNNINIEQAVDHIFGYAVGIDLTLRDIQSELKAKGLPWTKSKGFIRSAPISNIIKKEFIDDPCSLDISLKVNNETRQNSNTSKMIFKVDQLVHYIANIYGIRKGDLIFTGTPSGVSDLKRGDNVIGVIDKIGNLSISII